MMGQQTGGETQLFYAFNLDEYVPEHHLLRRIDRFLDLSKLRHHLADFYSHTGRPSVDPELMIRMLIVGYCFGIRSERRLCDEVHLNLGYRWFCRLGLEGEVPDHSTFSKNRHGRFRESDVLRFVFDEVVRSCMRAGLVKGEGFAVDASVMPANANWREGVAPDEIDWSDPKYSTRAVREYLAALDAGELPEVAPKKVSLTDPMARWTAATGPAFYAYSTNYLADMACGVIVDVEATHAHRISEVESTKVMIDRVEEQSGLKPERLIGDTVYGAAPMLSWLVDEKGIEPHIPVWDKTERTDGTFSRSDFQWDEEADEYRCPGGKLLRSRQRHRGYEPGTVTRANTIIYRASERDCRSCALKPQCCPNVAFRKIVRSVHEAARDVARQIAKTPEYQHSYYQRRKVEMLFAHLKCILKVDRLRLRGLTGAKDEFLLAATAQNLRKMANLIGQPPPAHRIGVPA